MQRSFELRVVSLCRREGTKERMSEARTPEEETIDTGEHEAEDDQYDGPDPQEDEKGDGADDDQGT